MVVVRGEKASAKKVHKAKKLAKQVATMELGFTKKLSKTLKGEREETFGPLNLKSEEGGALMENKSPRGKPPRTTSK
jgi:hypothetical protein